MSILMLKKGWPGNFRRTVYDIVLDEAGRVLKKTAKKVLEFKPGEPLEILGEDLVAVQADIGLALVPIALDEKNRPRPIVAEKDVEALAAGEAHPRMADLVDELDAAHEQIALLIEQVKELGAVPVVESASEQPPDGASADHATGDVDGSTKEPAGEDVPLGDEAMQPQDEQRSGRRGRRR